MDGVRFKRPVEPGDQLILEVELVRMKAGIFKFKARALVDDELAVEAELTCACAKPLRLRDARGWSWSVDNHSCHGDCRFPGPA